MKKKKNIVAISLEFVLNKMAALGAAFRVFVSSHIDV